MSKNYLITGGAGFIGSNYARRLLQRGENVTIFDNLSRHGAADNLKWVEEGSRSEGFSLYSGRYSRSGSIADRGAGAGCHRPFSGSGSRYHLGG